MTNRAWGEEYRRTHICVDAYNNGVLQGSIHNPWLPYGKPFSSLTQFLLEMEQVLNQMDFPKAFTATRAFAATPTIPIGFPAAEARVGQVATFSVRILFRQNASWQGSVTWLEGKQEQSFRSTLELILLMNSALTQPKAS